MVDLVAKKVLSINLEKEEVDVKSYRDLRNYIGGVGVGLKLFEMYQEKSPIVISVGPLNGFFPFVSKTSIVLQNNNVVEDIYIGGNISTRLKFAGIDSIVIYGKSKKKVILEILNTKVYFKDEKTNISSLGLPGKRSALKMENEKAILDNYFTTPEDFFETALKKRNIEGLVITGTEIYKPREFEKYEKIYREILKKDKFLKVDKGKYPSCSGCPMGCGKSKVGEIGGNVLLHSLVACDYSNEIYSDIGIVFSCLNVLGYDYTHEDIENLPDLIEDTLQKLTK